MATLDSARLTVRSPFGDTYLQSHEGPFPSKPTRNWMGPGFARS